MSKPHYPAEFKLETASLVLDQGYTRKAACEFMGVGKTALDRWVKQLRAEHAGETPGKAQSITETQREIRPLKTQIKRLKNDHLTPVQAEACAN